MANNLILVLCYIFPNFRTSVFHLNAHTRLLILLFVAALFDNLYQFVRVSCYQVFHLGACRIRNHHYSCAFTAQLQQLLLQKPIDIELPTLEDDECCRRWVMDEIIQLMQLAAGYLYVGKRGVDLGLQLRELLTVRTLRDDDEAEFGRTGLPNLHLFDKLVK